MWEKKHVSLDTGFLYARINDYSHSTHFAFPSMSSKPNSRIQKIQSLIRRNDWKQAYKEAKFLAKSSNDPELQPILISSLWNWIKELVRKNQYDEAKPLVRDLLQYQAIPTEVSAEFPPVFRLLGLNSLLPEDLRQDMSAPEIQTELVDVFLVRGEKNPDLLPENIADAERVRFALQSVEEKKDDEALEQLRAISFRSPLADWRLFIRGLIDHYNNEEEKAAESWKRLDPNRPAFRIVENLKKLLSEKQNPTSQESGFAGFFRLFRKRSDSPQAGKTELLSTLHSINSYIEKRKFKELIGRFQTFRVQFRESEPIPFERVFRIVHNFLIRNASPDVIRQFVERNLPLPLDPRGNRTYAIVADLVDDERSLPAWLESPTTYWENFAEKDIDQLSSFTPKMKARAKAIVYDYMAVQTIEELLTLMDIAPGGDDDQMMIDAVKNGIEKYWEKSNAADATYLDTYKHRKRFIIETLPKNELSLFHPQLLEVNEQLLQNIPDDAEALDYLLAYHLSKNDPAAAQPYFERYRALDPLSKMTSNKRIRLCLSFLRQGIKNRDFPQCEAAIRELDNGPPFESNMYRFDLIPLALKYCFDVVQGNETNLDAHFAASARLGSEKRLPLIYAILVEGQEIGVSEKHLEKLREEWTKTVAGRCNGNIAGALGDLTVSFSSAPDRYSKSQKLIKAASDFVNRASQVKWNCEKDLFGACNLLWELVLVKKQEEYEKTFLNLVRKGVKQFPNSAFFFFFDAETYWVEDYWAKWRRRASTLKSYQEFLKRFGNLRNDLSYSLYCDYAERRVVEIQDSEIFGTSFYDEDEDDDDDWDDNDDGDDEDDGVHVPFKITGTYGGLPPDVVEHVRKTGSFSPDVKKEMEQTLPKELGPLRKFMIEAIEECIRQGRPIEQVEEVMKQKFQNMSLFERMAFMGKFGMGSLLGGMGAANGGVMDDEDDDEDDGKSGFFPFFGGKNKDKKSK